MMLSEQTGSLISSLQIAGVDGAEGLVFHYFRQFAGLFYAIIGQGNIEMAIHAELVCIGGFAAAEQVNATAWCSFEGAGLVIKRSFCGGHEALKKALKKMASQ